MKSQRLLVGKLKKAESYQAEIFIPEISKIFTQNVLYE